MPLSFEEFKKLRSRGLSIDQIRRFEAGEKPTIVEQEPAQSPQPAQQEKPKSFIRKVGDFFTSAEQKFGQTLGTAASVFSPEVNRNRNAVLEQAQRQSDNYIKLAQQAKTPEAKKAFLLAARDSAQTQGVDIFNNPEYQKTARQIVGEGIEVGLDVLTAGSLQRTGAGAVKSAIKAGTQTAKMTAGKVAGKAALVGAGVGSAYGVAGAMQERKDLKGIVGSGITGGVAGGLTGGALSYGASKVANTSKFGASKAGEKQANNLNKIFNEGADWVRNKTNKFADRYADEGASIGEELTKRGVKPSVKNERLVFNNKHLASIEKEIAEKSRIIDEAAELYPVKLTSSELKEKAKALIMSDPALKRTGETQKVYARAARKIDDFISQNNSSEFSISQIQQMKKGMYDLSKKFKRENVQKSDAFSELGNIFMKVVEDEIPDVAVKNLNKEIGKAMQLEQFLTKVNQKGGIVLDGGKIGKIFSSLSGTLTGAGVGSILAGPGGAVIGGAVGNKVSSVLRNLSNKASILGPIDRLLIKGLKTKPNNAELLLAKKFIEEVKKGRTPTPSPRVEKIVKELIFGGKKPLLLEAPKQGASKVGINVPINMQSKSMTAKEAEEIANLQRQILGQKIKNITKPKDEQKLLGKPSSTFQGKSINLGKKPASSSTAKTYYK